MSEEYVLEMKDITKIYPNGVIANKDVNLSLKKNEIHALLGENGAGKSTLMKMLFGSEQPTEGKIFLNGEEVSFNNTLDAINHGIGMVHQHFMLDEELTVAENIILGIEPGNHFSIDYKKASQDVLDAAKKYNFNVKPNVQVSKLSVGQKQKVEILKALMRGADILILDEPTAVLTPQETKELFVQLEQLRDEGHTIIFISHKLNEVKEICSRATVLRNGVGLGSYNLENVTLDELSRLMIGYDIERTVDKATAKPTEVVLQIQNLSVADENLTPVVKNVSFDVRRGEILGIAGVEGNGQRELIDAITGLNEDYTGKIFLKGEELIRKGGIRQRRELHMTHIPEDRNKLGVFLGGSVEDNLIANRIDSERLTKHFMLDQKAITKFSHDTIAQYQIKTDDEKTQVKMLSGGNVQKVVAAREMTGNVDVLIADQPTRGIDVGAASFIHDQIYKMRNEEIAVLLSSADLNEILTVSDSLIVFYEGEITAYFEDASVVSEQELGRYMLGLEKMDNEQLQGVAHGQAK